MTSKIMSLNKLSINTFKFNISKNVYDHAKWYRNDKGQDFNDAKTKEKRRERNRLRLLNNCDPAVTSEEPIPSWSEKKGKLLYKFISEYANINNIVGKRIPEAEKKEFAQKTKEMNMFYLDRFRKEKTHDNYIRESREEMFKIFNHIPVHLKPEIYSGRPVYYEKHPVYNSLEDAKYKKLELSDEFLYGEQRLRLLPDESRCVERMMTLGFKEGDIFEVPEEKLDCVVLPLFSEWNYIEEYNMQEEFYDRSTVESNQNKKKDDKDEKDKDKEGDKDKDGKDKDKDANKTKGI